MKKIFALLLLLLSMNTFAEIKVPSAECSKIVEKAGWKKMKGPDGFGSTCACGLLKEEPKFIKVNAGGIYILPAGVNKIKDWKVVVVVDEGCIIKSIEIPGLE